MNRMINVLLRDFLVIDDKHIPIDAGNMSIGLAEYMECAIDDFIGRNDVMVVI
jgi:Mn-dependent DtxR family transcriptional regulator